jgi:hypothetical protein
MKVAPDCETTKMRPLQSSVPISTQIKLASSYGHRGQSILTLLNTPPRVPGVMVRLWDWYCRHATYCGLLLLVKQQKYRKPQELLLSKRGKKSSLVDYELLDK